MKHKLMFSLIFSGVFMLAQTTCYAATQEAAQPEDIKQPQDQGSLGERKKLLLEKVDALENQISTLRADVPENTTLKTNTSVAKAKSGLIQAAKAVDHIKQVTNAATIHAQLDTVATEEHELKDAQVIEKKLTDSEKLTQKAKKAASKLEKKVDSLIQIKQTLLENIEALENKIQEAQKNFPDLTKHETPQELKDAVAQANVLFQDTKKTLTFLQNAIMQATDLNQLEDIAENNTLQAQEKLESTINKAISIVETAVEHLEQAPIEKT